MTVQPPINTKRAFCFLSPPGAHRSSPLRQAAGSIHPIPSSSSLRPYDRPAKAVLYHSHSESLLFIISPLHNAIMHHRATSPGQRRPRLLRASMTEPSLFTSSTINHGSLDMSQMSPSQSTLRSSSSGRSSPTTSSSSYHRRAADLLNHVAYLSSCATSPVSSFISGTGATSRSRGSLSSSSSSGSSATRSHSIVGSAGTGTSSRATAHATADTCYRRANADEVFGSSPASTHTSSSIEDLQSRYPGMSHFE